MKCPETCLGIADLETGRQAVYESCHSIAEPAPERDVAGEPAAAQDQRVRVDAGSGTDLHGICHAVLAVGIHCHDDDIRIAVFLDE